MTRATFASLNLTGIGPGDPRRASPIPASGGPLRLKRKHCEKPGGFPAGFSVAAISKISFRCASSERELDDTFATLAERGVGAINSWSRELSGHGSTPG